jgi:hypothetical protein
MALSAFHIVFEQESIRHCQSQDLIVPEKYLLAAYLHYDIALQGYRHSLSDLNSQSCHPIFGCACLLFITALARPQEIGYNVDQLDPPTPPGVRLGTRLSEWIILIRGIPSVLSHNESLSLLRQGPMAIIITSQDNCWTVGDDHEAMDSTVASYLHDLLRVIHENSDQRTIEVCQSSIKKLHEVLRESSQPLDTALVFTWPMSVDPDYFDLLEQKSSEALLMFACYCVLLHSFSSRWWIKDWPRSILKSVEALIEDRWMPLLRWPLEKVFREQEAL